MPSAPPIRALRPLGATRPIRPSSRLANARYDILGPLARRADEIEAAGGRVLRLNVGNPGAFGFRTPEPLLAAVAANAQKGDGYCDPRGLLEAREAIAAQQRDRGAVGVTADDVVVGSGVSELVLLSMAALLDPGDEVLVPSPDYPLWTAATHLYGGHAVHYPCTPERGWIPTVEGLEARVTPRTRALVVISPNNPTGAVYPRALVADMVAFAERHDLVVFSDEIYDAMTYETAFTPVAPFCRDTLSVTLGGLSKIHRGCGWRIGWLSFHGDRARARDYVAAVDALASMRLCANVPGQYAVATALATDRSILSLTRPGGRLWESRAAVVEAVAKSRNLSVVAPAGAMYAFVGVDPSRHPGLDGFDDRAFARELLEREHVLVAPGAAFNFAERTHFRVTLLPEAAILRDVVARIDALLDEHGTRPRDGSRVSCAAEPLAP